MFTTEAGTVLVLRSSDSDRRSHGGFQWPESGFVEAPDWDPNPDTACGEGLHGLLWGQGDISLTSPEIPGRTWQIVEVEPADIADPDAFDKIRFRRGTVILSTSDHSEAATLLASHNPPFPLPFLTSTAGDSGTAVAGDRGTATAGDRGTAVAGDYGTATAGDYGTATAGYRGTAAAGDSGTLVIQLWDVDMCRYRLTVAYVGEGGILPNTPYRLDDNGKPVPA